MKFEICFFIIPVSAAIFAEVLNKKDAYQERLREWPEEALTTSPDNSRGKVPIPSAAAEQISQRSSLK